MKVSRKEIEVNIVETSIQGQPDQDTKTQITKTPKRTIKEIFHNFNNNRAQLLKAYIFLIFLFGFSFWGIDELSEREFIKGIANPFDYFYFTVVTITTLGYGEIVPITWLAKAMVMLLTLLGLYLLGMFLTASGHHLQKKEREILDGIFLVRELKSLHLLLLRYSLAGSSKRKGVTFLKRNCDLRKRLRDYENELLENSVKIIESFRFSENKEIQRVMNVFERYIKSSQLHNERMFDHKIFFGDDIDTDTITRNVIIIRHLKLVDYLKEVVIAFRKK